MKHFKELIIFVIASTLLVSEYVSAADANDLQEQLNDLKDEILILQDQLEETNIASTNEMSIAGYTDIEYHSTSNDGTNPGFRLHHMSLFFEKRVADDWKFFSEIEYEDAPFIEFEDSFDSAGQKLDSKCNGCYGKIFLEAANFTFAWKPEASFRGGRMFTPAGIWSINHYPSFSPTQIRPEHIRKIFPQVVDGLSTFGTIPVGNTFMEYDVYFGNGEGNSGGEDQNSKKASGLKLSFLMPYLKYFEFGISGYTDELNDQTKKTSLGAHAKFKFSSFVFQSEYAKADLKKNAMPDEEKSGYYAQLQYNIGNWSTGLRNDSYSEETSSKLDITNNSVFINYHISEAIVLKLEHHEVETEEDAVKVEYGHTIGSIVIYLGN